MKEILNVVKQNVKDAPNKLQDNKYKEYEKTQKQINELRGAKLSTKVKQKTL
jgi:hypothetical protein